MDSKRGNKIYIICHNASNSVQYKDNAFMDKKTPSGNTLFPDGADILWMHVSEAFYPRSLFLLERIP